jgi:hypothetical protein
LKFIPGFLKKKQTPEPAQPEAPDDKEGFIEGLKNRFRRKKSETPAAAPGEESESLFDLQHMKQKLSDLMDSKNRSHTANTVLVITGAGIAVAGMAADVAFLGGVGTVTVISCLYSDFRNSQHIGKISRELSEIDKKIDTMKTAQQPAPDYAPALSAVKSSIEDFQASAKRVPPEIAEGLAKLKTQVETLQDKIAPANDDGPAPRAATPPR